MWFLKSQSPVCLGACVFTWCWHFALVLRPNLQPWRASSRHAEFLLIGICSVLSELSFSFCQCLVSWHFLIIFSLEHIWIFSCLHLYLGWCLFFHIRAQNGFTICQTVAQLCNLTIVCSAPPDMANQISEIIKQSLVIG